MELPVEEIIILLSAKTSIHLYPACSAVEPFIKIYTKIPDGKSLCEISTGVSLLLFTFITVSIKPVICIGAALMDESFICKAETIPATSNPATFYRSPGGVACNIAHNLALLGHRVELISHFGNDVEGKWLMEACKSSGIGISHSLLNDADTGRYVAVLASSGELFIGAMSGHLEDELTPEFLESKIELLNNAAMILFDCNLSTRSLDWLLGFCRKAHIPCVIEPVSIPKASRMQNMNIENVLLITPNREEMAVLIGYTDEVNVEVLIQRLLQRGVQYLWIRKGKDGSGIYSNNLSKEIPAVTVKVTDITGAGDAAMAGWMHAWLNKKNPEDCVRYGHAMASIVLQVKGAIAQNIDVNILEQTYKKQLLSDGK